MEEGPPVGWREIRMESTCIDPDAWGGTQWLTSGAPTSADGGQECVTATAQWGQAVSRAAPKLDHAGEGAGPRNQVLAQGTVLKSPFSFLFFYFYLFSNPI